MDINEGASMGKEYDTFVLKLGELREGEETERFVRALSPGPRKYDTRRVWAILNSSSPLAQGDTLWIRFLTGKVHPQPWSIRILQVLE